MCLSWATCLPVNSNTGWLETRIMRLSWATCLPVNSNTGWLETRIMCLSWATCLPVNSNTGWLEARIMCLSWATCLPVNSNTVWLETRIMCLSLATCLPVNCSLSCYYNNPIKRVDLKQRGHHHHCIECNLFSPWSSWKFCIIAVSEYLTRSVTWWNLTLSNHFNWDFVPS
jgi:hypothetical protein